MTRRTLSIDINFASRDYRLLSRIYAGLLAVVALLSAMLALILWIHGSYRADIGRADQRLRELMSSEQQVLSLLAEREQLVRDLTAMSGLMESRRFSWTRLFTGIEEAFPAGVALGSVNVKPKERTLELDGMALSPEALRNLMIGLEKSSVFKDPLLRHQSVDKGSISFKIGALYDEHKAAGPARPFDRPRRK